MKSFKDLFSNELIIGAGGEGDSTRDFAVAENNILGTKFRVIQRYPGVRDTVLAIDRNEVEGVCGTGVPAMMVQRPDWVAGKGLGKMLVQQNVKGSAKLNAMGVPRTGDFAKSAGGPAVARTHLCPAAVRPSVRDAAGCAARAGRGDAGRPLCRCCRTRSCSPKRQKMNLDIELLSGTDLQGIVERIYATPAPVVKRAINALVYNQPK